jgi:predicted RNase H-like nuclease (RuvC/YqgF family)
VKDTQNKIEDLEKSLKKSKGTANAFSATIKKLKADLEERSKEITNLQAQVEQLSNENKNLITTTELQEAELTDKEAQIQAKGQELALIEARVQEIMIQSKMSEADSYYARGEAIEEAAKRTKLAPRKKKDTLREALELYKKAQSLGNANAQAKIDELEKKLK